jgi:threonyl-tRNA synthetase
MGIIGDKEQTLNVLSIRTREGKDLGQMKIDSFLTYLKENIDKKVT